MTSFVARASAEKQTFTSFDDFHAAVDDDKLKINPDDWLPLSLITTAFRLYGNGPKWELQRLILLDLGGEGGSGLQDVLK